MLTPDQIPSDSTLSQHIGPSSSVDLLAECRAEAIDIVGSVLAPVLAQLESGVRGLTEVPPDAVVRRAVLDTVAELYARKGAPSGVQSFLGADGAATPVRVGRDPHAAARAVLAPWLWAGGIG